MRFARLGRTAMVLQGKEYHRPAGAWSISFRESGGKRYAVGFDKTDHLDGLEFVEISKQEFLDDNGSYVDEKSYPE